MNLICIKDKLKDGVDTASRVSGDHPTLSILKNILIEAQKDKIKITGTNLEVGLQCVVPGKVVKDGSITVPAGLFSQIVNTLNQDRVTLSLSGTTLEVLTDSYSAKVQGSSAEEFPLIPKIQPNHTKLEVNADVLKDSLEKVLAAAQFSELRPELNTVFLQFGMDKLVLAATDSFRLAEKTMNDSEFKSDSGREFRALIPLKTAQELLRLLKGSGPVKIAKDENQIQFSTEEVEFISRLVDGNFPDYQAIIPKKFSTELTLDREEFINAVKLTGVFGSSVPEIIFSPADKGKGLKIYSRDEKLGENNYLLPAKIKGNLSEFSFNWRYILDGLKASEGKEVILGLSEENRPAILRSPGDASYFYIVMPILKG